MGKSAVLRVTCAQSPAPLIVSLFRKEMEDGRWYPEFFRINFSRCIMCGFVKRPAPPMRFSLPSFEMAEYVRQDMVWEKEDLLISGREIPRLQFLPRRWKADQRKGQR